MLFRSVVMDGKVWLTTATEDGLDYFVICVDAATGKVLANEKVFHRAEPEPLGNGFSAAHLAEVFSGKTQNIKVSLLDQRNVAGLGNIYVCEALYRARISPLIAAGKITRPRLETLAGVIRDVLNDAIAAGGSTLKDFANAEGGQGYFQHRFDVYGREGEPCRGETCTGVVARIVQGGRSTFYCPSCQKR